MLVQDQRNISSAPIRFDINEPQRYASTPETSRLAQCRYELSGLAYALFYSLITLRTKQNRVFASKKFLLKYTRIGSYHTLDKRLSELGNCGLIQTRKYYSKSATFDRPNVHHCITFPYFQKVLPTWDNEQEIPHKPSGGRELAIFAKQESYGSKIINNSDIPATTPPNFPQSTPETNPIAPLPKQEREENSESAVFLKNEPEQEDAIPVLPINQEKPVKSLVEDQGKDEAQVITEINELVATIKREKKQTGKVTNFTDDIACLKKTFGALPLLTGLKCMMETLSAVQNPGGWLRVHLKTPAWLNRFRDKLEDQHNIKLVHQKSYLATMARLAEDTKQTKIEAQKSEETDQLLAGLTIAERESLWVEARAILTEKRGILTDRMVEAVARTLARKKFAAMVKFQI
jgi:hypothetical protein